MKEARKKYLLDLLVTIVMTLQEVRINVYFILISESTPYVVSYRSIYSQVNTVGNFYKVLIEILFTNGWKQSFVKLPIPKLSLRNSAAFLSSAKASQRFVWKSNFQTLYTLASPKLEVVCFWIRDNQRYSKASYISARNKSWLHCGLSYVQL